MKKRLLIWCVVWLLMVAGWPVSAQTYFNERYTNGGLYSGATALALTPVGDYLLAAQGGQQGVVAAGALLLRFLSSTGQVTQTRYFSRPRYAYYVGGPTSLQPVQGGGYALAGGIEDSLGGDAAMLWRLDAQGDTLWTRTYARAGRSIIAYSCRQLADGGFILTGIQQASPITMTNQLDVWLLRTDSLGRVLWERTYDVGYYDLAYFVELTPDGGYVLSGYSFYTGPVGTPQSQNDALVLKVDSVGRKEWQQLLGTAFKGELAHALPTRDGGYIVASDRGKYQPSFNVATRPTFYKLDGQGDVVWQREYGPASISASLLTIHELADGSFVAAGQQHDGAAISRPEAIILKVCADGDSLWYRSYKKLTGGQSHNYLRDLVPTADGGFVAAGFLFAIAPDTGTNDTWAFKIDSAGYLQAGGAPVRVRCRPTGLEEEAGSEKASAFARFYPNPTAGTVQLDYHLPDGQSQGQVVVYDALGRPVRQLALPDHTGSLELHLNGLPDGLYYYSVSAAGTVVQTGKLVKQP